MRHYGSLGEAYGFADDTQDMLTRLGVGQNLALMATPGLWYTPAESDPSSQVTMIITQAVQKGLRKLGYPVRGDGVMDPATQGYITAVAGKGWQSRAWLQVFSPLMSKINTPSGQRGMAGLGEYHYDRRNYGSLGDSGDGLGAFNFNDPSQSGGTNVFTPDLLAPLLPQVGVPDALAPPPTFDATKPPTGQGAGPKKPLIPPALKNALLAPPGSTPGVTVAGFNLPFTPIQLGIGALGAFLLWKNSGKKSKRRPTRRSTRSRRRR